MGLFFSLFKKKSLDCEMDCLHDRIQSMRRNRSFSSSLITNIKRFQILSFLFGGTLTSFSFYSYMVTSEKFWFKISIGTVVSLLLALILLHISKSYLVYRVKRFEDRIIFDENRLRELFSAYLDEGSYKKVLLLKKKYDPMNRILKNVVIPDPEVKSRAKSVKDKKTVEPNKRKQTSVTSENVASNKITVTPSQPPFKTYANRGVFEKFIDRMLGDGPEYRNALICVMCHTHNGLVPPEDFLKISFKCYKCNYHHYSRGNIGLPTPCVTELNKNQSNEKSEELKESTTTLDSTESMVDKTDDSMKLNNTLPKPNFDDLMTEQKR